MCKHRNSLKTFASYGLKTMAKVLREGKSLLLLEFIVEVGYRYKLFKDMIV
jgi:hypothetical protein